MSSWAMEIVAKVRALVDKDGISWEIALKEILEIEEKLVTHKETIPVKSENKKEEIHVEEDSM